MFTALAVIAGTVIVAVGAAHTKPGRRILDRWTAASERTGLHRKGTPRELAEVMNRTRSKSPSRLLELAWIELVPMSRQVTMVQGFPTW